MVKRDMAFFGLIVVLFFIGTYLIYLMPGWGIYRVEIKYQLYSMDPVNIFQLAMVTPPQTPYQEVMDYNITTTWTKEPVYNIEERDNYSVLFLKDFRLPDGRNILTGEYRVKIYDTPLQPVFDPEPQLYLGPGPGMETANPLLVQKGRKLAPGGNPVEEIIKNINRFLSSFKVDSNVHTTTALNALNNNQGNPEDKVLLFSALCRTRGIATRVATGLKLSSLPLLSMPAGVSTWGIYYHPEQGWLRNSNSLLPTPFLEQSNCQSLWDELSTGTGRVLAAEKDPLIFTMTGERKPPTFSWRREIYSSFLFHNKLVAVIVLWTFLILTSYGYYSKFIKKKLD